MSARDRTLLAALGLWGLLVAASPVAAGGLRCSVGEVVIENLKIGHQYSLTSLANLPLSVTSLDESPLRVRIEPLIPDSSELRRGAEAAPNVTWATVLPDTLALSSHETRAVELQLTIPNDPSLLGRRFQITFWTHTLPREDSMLAYGLKSRVIFSIAATADSTEETPNGDIAVALEPAEIRLRDLAPDRTYALEAVTTRPVVVQNTSNREVTVELAAMGVARSGSVLESGDGELLDVARVTLEPASIVLAPGETRTITGTVSMGGKKSLTRKNLTCIIAAAITDQPVRTQIFSRLYVHVR